MRFPSTLLKALVALLPLALTAFATLEPTVEVQRFMGERRVGNYIVTFKEGVDKSVWQERLSFRAATANRRHEYDSDFLNGFAGELDDDTLEELRKNPDVEAIYEDGIMHTMETMEQTDAPWGLARLSQNGRLVNQGSTALTYTYRYDSPAGEGVDIYVIDTGVQISHQEFGGRARWGATFGGYPNRDGDGHGTHVAATAAGTRFGVAKKANIVAVKVLADDGSGWTSDIVAGLNYVVRQAAQSGRPTIASMSLGGGASRALDNAVVALTRAGIHVTVAAGNEGVNAGGSSPARVLSAITVGSSTISDTRSSFSNYGSVVDVFAPGERITSAWIGSDNSVKTISGTSMATPHVAGLVAYMISVDGNMSPGAMQTMIKTMSVKGILSGIPSGTANALARNDMRADDI